MGDPLRIDAPSADLAHALMRRLQAFPTELRDNGTCQVCVTLTGNPDQAVTVVLHEVDEWLVEFAVDRVRVHLDDRAYTLSRPQTSTA